MVVTWNAEQLVAASLASIPRDTAVIVVDNASTDGSTAAVAAARPEARIVVNGDNRGFAAAVNQALADVTSDYALLLNPDAVLEPEAVERLVAFGDAHPRAALVSALVVDEHGRPESAAGGREPAPLSLAVHEAGLGRLLPRWSLYQPGPDAEPARRDWAAGTALLVRMAAVRSVGALDESFFLYCEDVDWARRMRGAGWEVWVEPAARAVHGRSVTVAAAGRWVDEHRIESLDRYLARHHRGMALAWMRLVRLGGKLARAAIFGASGRIARRPELVAKGSQRRRDARLVLDTIRRRR